MASYWCRYRRAPAISDLSSRVEEARKRSNRRYGDRMRNCDSALQPRWRRSGLRLRRYEIGRQLRALAEEVLVHLLQQKLLGLRRAKVEAIFVHEHLHVLDPHLPGLLGDAVVD